jgi:hypothetical protein
MNGSPTFHRLVEMCGLSDMFAAHAMSRAIVRAGIWPHNMRISDVPAVLPEVARAIAPFFDRDRAEEVIQRIRGWWWSSTARTTDCRV